MQAAAFGPPQRASKRGQAVAQLASHHLIDGPILEPVQSSTYGYHRITRRTSRQGKNKKKRQPEKEEKKKKRDNKGSPPSHAAIRPLCWGRVGILPAMPLSRPPWLVQPLATWNMQSWNHAQRPGTRRFFPSSPLHGSRRPVDAVIGSPPLWRSHAWRTGSHRLHRISLCLP